MKLTRQTRFALWAAAAVLIAAVSFFAGTLLKPQEDPHYLFDTQAPAYAEPAAVAATSPGGFTGFGETDGTASRVVVGGHVTSIDGSTIVLEAPTGQRTTIDLAESPRIFRLEAGSPDLIQPGATVAVRLADDGETVLGVLLLSR